MSSNESIPTEATQESETPQTKESETKDETTESPKTETTPEKPQEPTVEEIEEKIKEEEAEKEKKIQQAKDKIKKQKELEKKQLEEQAKKEAERELILEQQIKKEKEKDYKSKLALVTKITQNAVENNVLVNQDKLSKMNLSELNSLYLGMVKRTLKEYKITCTKNCGFVEFADSVKDAISIKSKHDKICPKKTNYGNWIILGMVFTAFAGIGFSLYSQNKHAFKDPEK